MLSKNAEALLSTRYAHKRETADGVLKRVAKAISIRDEKFEKELYDAMVNGIFLPNSPAIRNAGIKKGSLSACLSRDTELLTKNGWKNYDYYLGDEVLTFNSLSEKMEFQDPIGKTAYKTNRMIRIKTRSLDILVTPNHKILYKHRNKNGTYKTRKDDAETLSKLNSSNAIITSGKYEFPINRDNLSLAECELLGWVITDGHFPTGIEGHKDDGIIIRQFNMCNELEYCLNQLDIEWSKHKGTYRIFSKSARKYRKYFNINDKTLKWSVIYSLSKEQMNYLWKGIYYGDAQKRRQSSYAIHQVHPIRRDQIQIIALLLGKRSHISTDTRGKNLINVCNVRKISWITNNKFSEEEYNDVAWCVQVPNENIIIRRNGKIAIVGNCFVLPLEDSIVSIFECAKNMASIFQRGGGAGINFSSLRPKNAPLSSGGSSSGALSFMGVFDAIINTVKQGGFRRGACLGALNQNHPEILDFCRAKLSGKLTNFNLSVMVTDEFMEKATTSTGKVDLTHEDVVYKSVRARDILDLITLGSWVSGDPGMLFYDRINKDNKLFPKVKINCTNPCCAKGTYVTTPKGYIPIENLKIGNIVTTTFGEEPIDKIEFHKSVPVYKVTFSDGGFQIVTSSHRYYAIKKKKSISKKGLSHSSCSDYRLDELSIGDYVKVTRCFIKEEGSEEDYKFNLKRGILIGDGCYTPKTLKRNYVKIASDKREKIYNENLKNLFREHNIRKDDFAKNCNSVSICLGDGKKLIKYLKLVPGYSYEKNIDILEFDNKQKILGLIDGLIATDGFLKIGNDTSSLRIDTCSYQLAQNVKRLFSLLGCHARIYSPKSNQEYHRGINGRKIIRKHTKYTVYLSGESLFQYLSKTKLSCIHPTKGTKAKEILRLSTLSGDTWKTKIVSIEPYGESDVYDIYCEESDTWITEGYTQRGCGEQPLPDFGACCLGSINVSKFVEGNNFDFDKFYNYVKLAGRALLNINTINWYPLPQITRMMNDLNSIGIGIMGFADALIMLGIKYDSQECLDFIDKLSKPFVKASEEVAPDSFTKRSIAPTGSLSILANCIIGDTLIYTLNGRYKIKDLVSKEPLIYCCDNKKIRVAKAINIRLTGEKREVWKVCFDTGDEIIGTPNHKLQLSNGLYCSIQDLKFGDSVRSFYRNLWYVEKELPPTFGLTATNLPRIMEHRAVGEFIKGSNFAKGEVVHHKDRDRLNNNPNNLEITNQSNHGKCHNILAEIGKNRIGKTYEEIYGQEKALQMKNKKSQDRLGIKLGPMPIERKKLISLKTKEAMKRPKIRERYLQGMERSGRTVTNHKVVKVEFYGYEDVYDLEVPVYHNFVANGVFIHNCSPSIEPVFARSFERHLTVGIIQETKDIYDSEFCRTAHEISPEWHLKVQAKFQSFIDSGVSKCVEENTILRTNVGLMTIKDLSELVSNHLEHPLKPGQSVRVTPGKIKIINGEGEFTDIEEVFFNGDSPAKKISLYGIGDIIVGENHKFFSVDGKWIKAKELNPGDFIVSKQTKSNNLVGSYCIEYENSLARNAKKITLPKNMSCNYAEFLGMLCADGSLVESTGATSLHEKNIDVGNRFDKLSIKLFNITPRIYIDKRSGVRSHIITSRHLVRCIKGLIGNNAYDKHTPKQIMLGSKKEQISFLNGVSLDGYVRKSRIKTKYLVIYSGVSKRLCDEMYSIVINLGLVAKRRTSYSKLKETIYITHQIEIKDNILNPIEKHKNVNNFKPFEKYIPLNADILNQISKLKIGSKRSHTIRTTSNKSKYIRNTVLERFKIKYDPSVYLVKVKNIEDCEATLYDVGLSYPHTYLINSLVSHNTVNVPNDIGADDIKQIYIKAWKMGVKGVTIFRDGSIEGAWVATTRAKCDDEYCPL